MTDLSQMGSPFDGIRHEDERGEYWSARDLMPVMGYGADWRNFADVVARATAACANSGAAAADHFVDATKKVPIGSGATRRVADFRLTRYGAYLVAMNGDPRKAEVAGAQTYFAVKTREAEVAPSAALPSRKELALMVVAAEEENERKEREIEAQRAQLAIAAPKAEYVDGFVDPIEDASTVKVFANQLGTTEPKLRAWLRERRLVQRRVVENRWSRSKQRVEPVYEWLAYADYRTWFVPRDQPEAPRLHNGQMQTTLYVTPLGKVQIRRLLMKHPIEDVA